MTVAAIATGLLTMVLVGPVLAQPADNLGNGQPASAPQSAQLQPAPAGQVAPAATEPASTQPRKTDSQGPFIWVMLGAVVLMWLFMGRNKRKQAAKKKEMLSSLKKGDRVTSIGGIIGSVVEVREDEVVLKIDDNSRMHLARWAIRGVGEEAKQENPDAKK
ncbi:MAG: preprotein translocase subunit YajC [Planctomycetaceae bacterium]|nr:preprotein translocase subunit YajC [Planctomycetaceae bacterium]